MSEGITQPASLVLKLVIASSAIQHQTVTTIENSSKIAADLAVLEAATGYIEALADLPCEPGSSLHNQQLFGLRIFNTSLSALQLGTSGFYQAGLAQVRDLMEVYGLLMMFRLNPSSLPEWVAADEKQRSAKFRPVKVREFLAKHKQVPSIKLQGHYETYSTWAAHPTYDGFRLLGPDNKPRLGPFFDEKFFRELLHDLTRFTTHAVVTLQTLVGFPEGLPKDYVAAVEGFLTARRGLPTQPDNQP